MTTQHFLITVTLIGMYVLGLMGIMGMTEFYLVESTSYGCLCLKQGTDRDCLLSPRT